MAKLGVQLKKKQEEQQQGRETRKQRVARQQLIQRNILAQQRHEAKVKRAEQFQKDHFKDKVVTVDENVYHYRPKQFTKREWDKMRQKDRDAHLRSFRGQEHVWSYNIGKGNLVLNKTTTRKVQKTIPFTIDDSDHDYGDVYDTIPDDLKPFFSTHDVVKQQKVDRIVATKKTVQEKLAYADQKYAERTKYWDDKIKKREEWWSSKSSSYRNQEGRKERHKERLNDYEDDQEEDQAKWRGYKKGLQKGSAPLNQNKDINFSNIESYAWDVASYEEDKEEARNDARNSFNKSARSGDLNEAFKQLGYKPDQKVSYYNYKKDVKAFNKKVDAQKSLISYGERVGFDKLTVAQKNKINPDLAQWQWENPNEKLIFKGLTPIGVESGSLQQSMSIDNYQKVTSPDYIYDQWKKKNPAKTPAPVYDFQSGGFQSKYTDPFAVTKAPKEFDFKVLTAGKELPYDYGSQQTAQFDGSGNIVPPTQIMDTAQYNKIKNTPSTPIGDVWDATKGVYSFANKRIHWDFKIGGSPSMPKLNVISFGLKDDKTNAEQFFDKGTAGIEKSTADLDRWAIGGDKIDDLDQRLETKYQGQYQYEFEQKHMKDLIYGDTTFEKASEEFAGSKEAENIQKRYGAEYGQEYKELQKVSIKDDGFVDWGRADVLGGVGQFGLGIGGLGVKAVSTPLNLGTTVTGVYGGVKLLGAIPTGVQAVGLAGLGTYGTYKFLDPDSSYIEAGAGLVTAGLSFGTLGYMGYQHLKTPVVKVKTIKSPKMNLKATGSIGKDVKVIQDGVTKANKVVYHSQKLSQQGIAGHRTIVTTKGRVLSNKFWKQLGVPAKHTTLDSNAIYSGVPTKQATARWVDAWHGMTKVKQVSQYQKAHNLLTKYGYSNYQATQTLRYQAPRVYEQYLNKGVITIKGQKATAMFEHVVKRPVISVDKNLGIKTRGGADLKDITKVTRQLVKDANTGKIYAKYSSTRGSGFVDKKGVWKDWKEVEFTSGKTFVKASDLTKGYEHLGKVKGVDVYDTQALYRDYVGISRQNTLGVKISKTRANINVNVNLDPTKVKLDVSNQRLYDRIIDLDKGKGAWVKPANIKKTPFSKTFGAGTTPKVTFSKATGKTSNIVKDVMKKIDKVDDFSTGGASGNIKAQSKYWGTGQYEQQVGHASPHLTQQQIVQNQNLLKSVTSPDLKYSIGKMIKVKQFDALALNKIGTLSAIGLRSDLKTNMAFKSDLKLDNLVKVDLKTDVLFKTEQLKTLKTSPALKTQLKSLLKTGLPPSMINAPAYKPTPYKTPKISTPKIPLVLWLKAKKSKGTKKGSVKGFDERAYLPDFTSRALGLKPETLSQKQAKKKLKKLMTGLEIRRGVKIA